MLTTVGYIIGPLLAALGGSITVHWVWRSGAAQRARAERSALRAQQWEAAIAGEPTAPIPGPRPVPAVANRVPVYSGRSTSGRVAGVAGSMGGAI